MVSAVIDQGHNPGISNFVDRQVTGIEETQFDYIVIRNNSKPSQDRGNTVWQWFNQSDLVSRLSFKVIPADKIFHKERFILKFALAEKYASYFPLLKGLFGFRKPSGLNISSDRSDRSFVVEFSSDIEDKSVAYFTTIFRWLSKEVHFKAVLKEVIRFEQKVNREQSLLLSALQNAVA